MLPRKLKNAFKAVPSLRTAYHAANRMLQKMRRQDAVRRYCVQVPRLIAAPVFVKVGANDGITGDPVSEVLLADERWKGLLIEPAPPCFQRLVANFGNSPRFAMEQVAIGKTNGEAAFYFVDPAAAKEIPGLPSWFDQLGSFDRNHIVKHLGGLLEPFIIEQRVPVRRLADVLRSNGIHAVHLLQIDTEGYDFELLKTLDLAAEAPSAIYIEHRHLGKADRIAMLQMLRDHNYRVDDCGGDYFAVHCGSPLRRLARDRARILETTPA